MMGRTENSIDEFSERLATAVVEEIKEAEIKYNDGLTADGSPVVGNFNGELQ